MVGTIFLPCCLLIFPRPLRRFLQMPVVGWEIGLECVCVLLIFSLRLLQEFVVLGHYTPAQTEEHCCGAVHLIS